MMFDACVGDNGMSFGRRLQSCKVAPGMGKERVASGMSGTTGGKDGRGNGRS